MPEEILKIINRLSETDQNSDVYDELVSELHNSLCPHTASRLINPLLNPANESVLSADDTRSWLRVWLRHVRILAWPGELSGDERYLRLLREHGTYDDVSGPSMEGDGVGIARAELWGRNGIIEEGYYIAYSRGSIEQYLDDLVEIVRDELVEEN